MKPLILAWIMTGIIGSPVAPDVFKEKYHNAPAEEIPQDHMIKIQEKQSDAICKTFSRLEVWLDQTPLQGAAEYQQTVWLRDCSSVSMMEGVAALVTYAPLRIPRPKYVYLAKAPPSIYRRGLFLPLFQGILWLFLL